MDNQCRLKDSHRTLLTLNPCNIPIKYPNKVSFYFLFTISYFNHFLSRYSLLPFRTVLTLKRCSTLIKYPTRFLFYLHFLVIPFSRYSFQNFAHPYQRFSFIYIFLLFLSPALPYFNSCFLFWAHILFRMATKLSRRNVIRITPIRFYLHFK